MKDQWRSGLKNQEVQMRLKQKAIGGLIWTFSQQFSVQAINFVVQLVLARLLLPEDFGLVAMLSVFMALGTSLTDSGLTSSLIRTKEAAQRDYSTVFFMNLVASLLIYIVLFFSAPLIASFFDQPMLVPIIRLYTCTFIIRAFSQVQQTKLTKEMNFKLQMLIQIPSVIIAGIAGVLFAYHGMGVWSLVYMNIIQVSLSAIQLWFRTGWWPSLEFDWQMLKSHLNFGYKLTLAGILNTIFTNLYNVIIGKYFSATQLGYYNRADTLRMFPVQNLATALNKVTYPMFSSIQEDNTKLKEAYRMLMQQVIFWLLPLMAILIIVAKPLFVFLLTDKWLPAVPYFQWLCIAGLMYPLNAYNLNILNVKGRSDLFLRLEVIKKVIITLGVILAIPYGIYGLIYFQVASTILAYFINSYYSGKLIDYSASKQLMDILPSLALATLVGVMVWLFYRIVEEYLNWPKWVVISIVGISYFGVYLIVGYLLRLRAYRDFKTLILKR